MTALQQFFESERLHRGWSMKEIADKSKISLSKAYQIRDGEDNVEFETFENIASAFGMTPAELATVIGKGRTEDDPETIEAMAIFRRIAAEKRSAARDMLLGLVLPRRTVRTHGDSPIRTTGAAHKSRPKDTGDELTTLHRVFRPLLAPS